MIAVHGVILFVQWCAREAVLTAVRVFVAVVGGCAGHVAPGG